MARNYSSIAGVKTLANDITSSSATQLTLSESTDDLPSPPFTLVINPDTIKEEIVTVQLDQSEVSEPTYKIIRGQEETTATTHTAGDTVKHMITGRDLQEPHDHLSATEGHGATGAVVGTTNTQTLTNKTLTSPKINENVALTATSTELNYVDGVTSAIQTQLNTLTSSIASIVTVPTGVISQFAGAAADVPTGWLLCDGSTFSSTTYSTLATLLADKYGTHSGTNYYLPNLKGKIPVGLDAAQSEFDLLGETGGTKTHALTSAEMPRHNHGINPAMIVGGGHVADPNTGNAYSPVGNSPSQAVTTFFTGGSGTTEAASNGDAHQNLQPYIVVNYIIKH